MAVIMASSHSSSPWCPEVCVEAEPNPLSDAETFCGLLPPSSFPTCSSSDLPFGILIEHGQLLVRIVATFFLHTSQSSS